MSLARLRELAASRNAAPMLSLDTLSRMAARATEGYDCDLSSRAEWEDEARRAMKAAKQTREAKSYPFPGSANVKYPLIAIASMQFNARAYPAICQGRNVVRVGSAGQDGARAARVSKYMNHQLVDGMPGWEHEMDVLTAQIPVLGSAFKKVFWDGDRRKPVSVLISAFDFVVNSATTSLEDCPRMSHKFSLYPYQIEERVRRGTFLDALSAEYDQDGDPQHKCALVEQHLYYDVDGDGLSEPWILTFSEETREVVRLVAGFDPEDITLDDAGEPSLVPRETFFVDFSFLPDPDGGFYGRGFGHLLASFGDVIDTSFNQMLDAGHLQNAGGGFIGAGLDFQSQNEEFFFEPGKYYYVTSDGGEVQKNIVPMMHPGPSTTLFQLLGMMMEDAKQMVSVQDILTGAVTAQTMQPTTLMALIDQGMKVFTAIYKRVYDSLSREFKIIYDLNSKFLQQDEYSAYLGEQADVGTDFAGDDTLVTPTADPNAATMLQRVNRASFLAQLLEHPVLGRLLNPQDILLRLLAAAEVDDIQKALAPPPTGPQPQEQLAIETAIAGIEKTKSETARNLAAAQAAGAGADLASARAAASVMEHQLDLFKTPTAEPAR